MALTVKARRGFLFLTRIIQNDHSFHIVKAVVLIAMSGVGCEVMFTNMRLIKNIQLHLMQRNVVIYVVTAHV